MILRTKRVISLFMACAFMLSLLGNAAEAAVAVLLSPKANDTLGKIVDVSVKYDSQSKVLIDTAVLYVDNAVYETKKLKPAKTGVVSFDWNTSNYAKGQHYLRVVLFAGSKKVTEVTGYGVVSASVDDVVAPKVSLANVKDNETVSGTKIISINAKDDSGEAPIVSLLVDKKLKLMQNTSPYAYSLDTTALADGKHQIEVYAFDLEGNQSDVVSYTINVNNSTSVTVAQNTDKTYVPAGVSTAKSPALSTRPSVTVSDSKGVGRISDSEISASLSTVKSAPVNDTNLAVPVINSETTKIVLKDPVISSKVASAPALKSGDIKLSVPESKVSRYSLNVPKVKTEPVLTAKKINDSKIVESQIKVLTDVKTANINLDTPKPTVKAETKTPAPVNSNVLVASAVSGKSVVSEPMIKVSAGAAKVAYDINTPKVAETKPVLKAEAKPVLKAEAKKAVPAAKAAVPAQGKAKIRNLVEAENGTLLWDNRTKTVTAYVNNVKLELKIGSKKAKVNGKEVTINLVPQLKKGRTIIDITDYKNLLAAPALKD